MLVAYQPEPEPHAAISYAHGRYDAEIVALADRLNAEGVECELDLYDEAPSQGWQQWMLDTLRTHTVIAVCTAEYADRVTGRAPVGVGRGVAWEGRIIKQRVYDDQGRNEGVVPVVFSATDIVYIPDFLGDVTHYDLSAHDGYELLYRRLTRQPRYVKPPLGTVRKFVPKNAPGPPTSTAASTQQSDHTLVLLDIPDIGAFTVPAIDIVRDTTLKLVLAPNSNADAGYLAAVRTARKPIDIAYRLTGTRARVRSMREIVRDGAERVELELVEDDLHRGFGSDMSYNNISADELATMRARRILLDEKLPKRESHGMTDMSDTMLELFVSGRGGTGEALAVSGSPFPALAANGIADRSEFISVAQLFAVLLLRLSGVVERILRLALHFIDDDTLRVDFAGMRAQVYSNREARRIDVNGTCKLSP